MVNENSGEVSCLDFNRSFLYWKTKQGSVGRFKVESRCAISCQECGDETFYLTSSIMAGNVYAERDLPKFPVYGFQVAASQSKFIIFRDYQDDHTIYDTAMVNEENFDSLGIDTPVTRGELITDWHQLSHAVRVGMDLLARIRPKGWSSEVELTFPVKHINLIERGEGEFQVETGPVLFPYGLQEHPWHGGFSSDLFVRSFAYFNCWDMVEFLLPELSETWRGKRKRMYTKTVRSFAEIEIMSVGTATCRGHYFVEC